MLPYTRFDHISKIYSLLKSVFQLLPISLRSLILRFYDKIQKIDMNSIQEFKFYFPDEKNFNEYFVSENMLERINNLKCGLDESSIEIIDQKLDHFLNLPSMRSRLQENIRCLNRNVLYTEDQILEQEKFLKSLPAIKRQLKLKTYLPEVIFYHHALRLLPKSFSDYICDSYIIDVGASYGDSAVVFGKYYNPKKVISFELTNNFAKSKSDFFNTIGDNALSEEKFEFVQMGVGSKNEDYENGPLSGAKLTTLDHYLRDLSNIKYIKMDIEGAAYEAVLGTLSVIKKNHPILVLSCYHTPREFFELKPLLEQKFPNYRFRLFNLNFAIAFELETVLVCCPPELNFDF